MVIGGIYFLIRNRVAYYLITLVLQEKYCVKFQAKIYFLAKASCFFFLKRELLRAPFKAGFLCFSEHLYMPGLDNCPPDADRAWLDVQNL